MVHHPGNQFDSFLEIYTKLKLQYFGHLMRRVDSLEKTDAGRDWGQEEKGTTEDETAGWHHWLDGREFEWTPADGDGQGGLACCEGKLRLAEWVTCSIATVLSRTQDIGQYRFWNGSFVQGAFKTGLCLHLKQALHTVNCKIHADTLKFYLTFFENIN